MVLDNQTYFVVEGNIGAGKSTFIKLLNKYLNAQIVPEPHHLWQEVGNENLLDMFYKDPKRWGYTFQTYAFVTRVMEQKRYSQLSNKSIQILERSVYSDRYCFAKNCYENKIMSELEWHMYKEWFGWLVNNYVNLPSGFIYLKTTPEVCYQRIQKRQRSEEIGVSFEYLKSLHDKHESWLIEKSEIAQNLKNIPVLTLYCDNEFETNDEVQKQHVSKILEFFEGNYGISKSESLLPNILL